MIHGYPKIMPPLKAIALALFFSVALAASAQEEQELSIVIGDSTWGKEIIVFPIDWAPKLTFDGFEELLFAPEWSNTDHEEFWSLVMSWDLQANGQIPLEQLRFNLAHYFDGLMKPNHWSTDFKEPKAVFFEEIVTGDTIVFKGKMDFFDGFYTGKPMSVHILGEQLLCQETGRSIVLFRISPKDFTDPIWKKLNSFAVKTTICDE